MNLRFLKTLVAISRYPTFVAAGEAIGLSHSAVSVHIKSLEEELNVALVDRSKRPPRLTDKGSALVDYATRILTLVDEASALANEETLIGSIKIGVVPSALANMLPPALASLRELHPKLHISVRTGLSADLLQLLRNREIDLGIMTDPPMQIPGVRLQEIAKEPIQLIAPQSAPQSSVEDLFQAHPFIWFDRRSWAGQQIERYVQRQRFHVNPEMEVTALDSIASLVLNGLGISVVPKPANSQDYQSGIKTLALPGGNLFRHLVMVDLDSNPRAVLCDALLSVLRDMDV